MAGNGWTQEVEEEMRDILRVIRAKDKNEYVSVGKLVLALNKRLTVAGPALAGAATLAAAFIGSGEVGASRRTSRRTSRRPTSSGGRTARCSRRRWRCSSAGARRSSRSSGR
uniref:Uncharacterized protein n=1 Tax=Oryza glaberrima TaxID=4538 RepID=I1P0H7_ORYGL